MSEAEAVEDLERDAEDEDGDEDGAGDEHGDEHGADHGVDDTVHCGVCARAVPKQETSVINGNRITCASCTAAVQREVAASVPTGRGIARAFGAGLVGALVGGAFWAAVTVVTNFQVGFIATLVGYLAGQGVKLAAGKQHGKVLQYMAVGLALVGMVAAKYMIFAYVAVKLTQEHGIEISYFDPRIASLFPGALDQLFDAFDLIFGFLAVLAAWRVTRPPVVTVVKVGAR